MTSRPLWSRGRIRGVRGLVLLAGTVLAVAPLGPPTAVAAPGEGHLRLAHLSPDTPAVDVYLYAAGRRTPQLVLKHVGYGAVSPYQRLEDGTYAVAMRPADAAPASPPVLSTRVRVHAHEAYTVAGLGPYKGLRLKVLRDALTAPAGGVALRVIQASLKRPTVRVTAHDRTLADGLRFPAVTGYRSFRAGATTVRLSGGSGAPLITRLTLSPGTVHTLVVLDGTSGARLLDVRDAAGPSRPPRGGVETGLGGLAGRVAPPAWALSTRLIPLPAAPPLGVPDRRTGPYAGPRALRIPAIGVRTPLEPLGTDARGRLRPPGDPAHAGWFAGGVRPGAVGPAVIAGHVDSRTGPAVFTRLGSLGRGTRILVTDARGRTTAFAVDRVASFPKERFPTREVYGATPDPQLRLITCGGAFDPASGHYRRDVVVFASLTS
jgi:Domain of unknown function (DUF4397)/Sortase domain